MKRTSTTTDRRRGALLTLELILVLPIVLGLLFALIEFGLLFSGNQTLKLASEAGAQVAAMPGPIVFADVDAAVSAVLQKPVLQTWHTTTIINDDAAPGEPVKVKVSVQANDVTPDLLAFLGFSISSLYVVGETTLIKQ